MTENNAQPIENAAAPTFLTKRRVFNKVKAHLLAQGKKSLVYKSVDDGDGVNLCAYRAADGVSKCAAGALIADEHFNPLFNSESVHNLGVQKALIKSGVDMHDPHTFNLVVKLQRIHDSINFGPEAWAAKLDALELEVFGVKQLTQREVFEKVKTHLLEQNSKAEKTGSASWDKMCVYRTDDGKKCAAGFLIADEHYDPAFEGGIVAPNGTTKDQAVCAALVASGVDLSSAGIVDLLRELQRTHDGWDPSDWPRELDALEQRFFGAKDGAQ